VVLLIRRTVRPRGYASGFGSPRALLDNDFERSLYSNLQKHSTEYSTRKSNFVLSHASPCDVLTGERAVLAARGGWVKNVRLSRLTPCGLAGRQFEPPLSWGTL